MRSQLFKITLLSLLLAVSSVQAQETPIISQDSGSEHIQFWMKTLETHPFILLRKQAARHLGNMQNPMATPSLIKGLADADEDVRIQSAYSLARMGDTNALRPLYELNEKDPSKEVQAAARNAIDKINSHEEYKRQQKQKLKDLDSKKPAGNS